MPKLDRWFLYCLWWCCFCCFFLSSSPSSTIGQVSGTWVCFFVCFVFSNFCWLDSTQQDLFCVNKSPMKHIQKTDWKSDVPWFSYGYRKCMFVDFLLDMIHRSSQSCSLLRSSPIFFRHVCFMIFVMWFSLNYIPIKYRGPINKNNHVRPVDFTSSKLCWNQVIFSSKVQSSMTMWHHKLLTREGRIWTNGWTKPSSMIIFACLFRRSVIQKVTIVTLNTIRH